jgi:hypothetical protein
MALHANQALDQMLESAVVVAWDDLVPMGKPGPVHIQYQFAGDHSLANLQVWASEGKGHWMLVCEYVGVPSARKDVPLTFNNGYRSDALTQLLGFIITQQSSFARAPELDRDSLVQVHLPTENEKAQALKSANEALAPNVLHGPMTPAFVN